MNLHVFGSDGKARRSEGAPPVVAISCRTSCVMNDGFGHACGRRERMASSAAPSDMCRSVIRYAAVTLTLRLWPKAQWTMHRPPDASHARMNAPVVSKCSEMSAARVSSTLTRK